MPDHTPPRPSADPLSRRLDHEWERVRRRPRAVVRARSWGATPCPFADLDELVALAGYRVPATPAANDVLARLVSVACHDELATRVVLRRLLPGLLAAARRHRGFDDQEGGFEELVGAAWLAIVSCRTDHRPECVAGNLVRDATYRAFTAPRRRRSSTEVSVDPRTLEDTPATIVVGPCEELAGLLAEARQAGMDGRDVQLVRDLVRIGSPSVVAATRGVTPRTVRNHRDRATAHLRRVALAA